MAGKSRPYELFGSFILFKRLEADSLGDLWRAGRLEGGQLSGTVALRRLSGGNREAIAQSAAEAREIVPMLSGTSFVRSQSIGVVDGVPYVAYDYAGGRSLRHIVDRARGGTNQTPNPIPLDQAIVIAEKVALSLATTGDLKYGDKRLMHGALLPQFIWISDDGEIRVAGQQLGRGIVGSLRDTRVAGEIGRYVAPEIRGTAAPTKTSEVYAMGAILYLLTTGNEPPDALTASAFVQTVRAAKTMGGQEMPPDIRAIVEKSLNLDPAMRYTSMTEMKQALSALAHGGKYSASTFNLAFYLSNLLKKEMESEALDREKESKVNVAAYAAPAHAAEPMAAPPMFGISDEPKKRNLVPLYAAGALVVAGAVTGGVMLMRGGTKPAPAPAPPPVRAAVVPPPKPMVVSQPVVAATTTAPSTTTMDAAAQKKAFEAAVEQKLQEQMMKLQKDYTQQLKQQQSKNAPVTTVAAAAPPQSTRPQAEDRTPSAAALDERRMAAGQTQSQLIPSSQNAPQQQAQSAPQQPPGPQPAQPQPAAPPVKSVREGDIVDVFELDAVPGPVSAIRPIYPPMARRAKLQATVVLTTLIDETGRVVDVKVLKGDPRFGFNEEAIRAIRSVRFSPPMKDGKHVKTWRPQTISFQP